MATIAKMSFSFQTVPDSGKALVKFDFKSAMAGTWQCLEGGFGDISRLDVGHFEKEWQQQEGHFNWQLTNDEGFVLQMLEAPEGPSDPHHEFGRFKSRSGNEGSWEVMK